MKTLIFDLGMVLVHFRWREFLTDMGYEGERKDGLAKAMFQNPLWQEFDRGVMGDANVIAEMKKSLLNMRRISTVSGRRRISVMCAILLPIRRS